MSLGSAPTGAPTRAPANDASRLAAAGVALGLDLDPTLSGTLLDYLALLQRWNRTYNLTAVRDPSEMLVQHLFDCLAVVPPLRRSWTRPDPRLLDVGSGGGLPGVVIAALCPQCEVVCVDSVGKKAAFIRQVAGELRLRNLRAQHARVESLKLAAFDTIVSRAFASLGDFTTLTRPLLADGGIWMAMKAHLGDAERAALPPDVEMFHVEPLRVPELNAERCLVWLRPLAR